MLMNETQGIESENRKTNAWEKIANSWESLSVAQKAYVGSLALLIGVNVVDNLTTIAGLSSGNFQESGMVAAPMLELYGLAGLWLSKLAITGITMAASKAIDITAHFGNIPGKDYLGTAAAVTFSVVSMGPVINNVSLLLK